MSVTFRVPGQESLDFNVSNTNARLILYDLLGYGSAEKESQMGELTPDDVLLRLALSDVKVASLLNPIFNDGAYKEKTLDEKKLWGYINQLKSMAEQAIELGEFIHYS